MLVNEFLKDHRKVEEQRALMARTNEGDFGAKIAQQQKSNPMHCHH